MTRIGRPPSLLRKKSKARFRLRTVIGIILLLGPAEIVQAAEMNGQMLAAERQREQIAIAMAPSIEKQKASIRRQKKGSVEADTSDSIEPKPSDFFITENLIQEPAISADCDPLSQLQVQSLTDRASKANGLSADLVRAVMKQESAFRPCALSPVGAVGLMQLMPGTAAELGVADASDPEENVFAGARLLRKLMDRYGGDLNRTLAAYNAGPSNVDKADGVPPFPETITYVDTIIKNLESASQRRAY